MVPNGVADHVLVFLFQSYLVGGVQPFGWFGNKGTGSGIILMVL